MRTGGLVTGAPRSRTFKAARIHIVATSEQRPEQRNLGVRRRPPVHRRRICVSFIELFDSLDSVDSLGNAPYHGQSADDS